MLDAALKEIGGRFDLLRIMSIVTSGASPDSAERKVLNMALNAFGGKIVGPLLWTKACDYMQSVGWAEIAEGYILDGSLSELSNLPVPENLLSSRLYLIDALNTVLGREATPELAALIKCPSCGYTHGVHS